MTVALDTTFATSAAGTGTLTWKYTPVGTPKGILVFVAQDTAGGADQVTGVTYGGSAMTEVTGSPVLHSTGEPGAAYAYFLGSSVPTGVHMVQVSVSGAASKRGAAIGLTAVGNTQIVTTATVSSDSLANPSLSLSVSSFACFSAIGFHSGSNATSSHTVFTNWNKINAGNDWGTKTGGWMKHLLVTTQDHNAGYTAAADDVALIAVAVRDSATPTSSFTTLPTSGTIKELGFTTLTVSGKTMEKGFAPLSLSGSLKELGFATLNLAGAIVSASFSSFSTLGISGTIKELGSATLAAAGSIKELGFSTLGLSGTIKEFASATLALSGTLQEASAQTLALSGSIKELGFTPLTISASIGTPAEGGGSKWRRHFRWGARPISLRPFGWLRHRQGRG